VTTDIRASAAKPPPVESRLGAALAVLSGVLYFLAFPGVDLAPLAAVALVPLAIALRGQPPRRAAWLGWLAGFTMTMLGFYWLLEMLETYSGFPRALCVVFMAILCAYQAGRIALLAFLSARAERNGWPFELAFVLAFAASEQAFPLLFPWSYAATVHSFPTLVQLAEIGGPILVGLPLVAVNLAIAELVFARRERRALRSKVVLALLLLPVVASLYGVARIASVDARVSEAPKGRVGLVQANMSLFGDRRELAEGLRRHLALTHELAQKGPLELVVWSETSVMRAVNEAELERAIPEHFSRDIGVPALVGAVLVRPVNDERRYVLYNSAILTDAAGEVRGRYDKQFLLAFGEYLPFGEFLPVLYRISPNSGRFTPGKRFEPLSDGRHELATFICYEDVVPSFVNEIVGNGNPDLLVNLTNDAWFGDTTEPWIHLALAKLRAVEHRRFFVRSTNSGVSAIVDPVGRVVARSDTFKAMAIDGTVAWLKGTTVYEVLGDGPWWLVTLVALYAAARTPPRCLLAGRVA
jgi:apolipoprotein N-acyltransferase